MGDPWKGIRNPLPEFWIVGAMEYWSNGLELLKGNGYSKKEYKRCLP